MRIVTKDPIIIKPNIVKQRQTVSTFSSSVRNYFSPVVDNIYQGKSVFLVSNGPSFKDVDWSLLKNPGIVTYGLNNGANFFRPDLWTACDNPYKFIDNIYLDPKIQKIVPKHHLNKKIWDFKNKCPSNVLVKDCPNVVSFELNENFDPEKFFVEKTINWGNSKEKGGGRSTLIAMIKICYALGFRRIYLIGCDFDYNLEDPYFFKEKRTKGNQNHQNKVFKKKNDVYFEELAPYAKKHGLDIFNCTKNSKLEVFPRMELKDAIDHERIDLYDDIWGYDLLTKPETKNN